MAAIDIASRRELMVDDCLFDSIEGHAGLKMHTPIPREIVITHDRPWEGNTSGYHTIFRDGPVVRMYYRGSEGKPYDRETPFHPQVTCYAESPDGIHFEKPCLGLFEFEDAANNNIVLTGLGSHNFTPFRDTNPDCADDARYKGVGYRATEPKGKGLGAFASPDGIHWRPLGDAPIITDGKFDSQNLAFYDTVRGEYRCYYRDFADKVRGIKTCVSQDFMDWSPAEWLDYGDAPEEQLYTNQVQPYDRAPHLFVGFPTRFLPDRGQITEGVLMTSRDGVRFKRWEEALIRAGQNPDRWGNRANYIWWGIVETPSDVPAAPNELSLYSIEGYYDGLSNSVRRFTLRIDGFVSLNAPLRGGEMVTKPLVFEGSRLSLNVSTSAAGAARVALLDEDAREIEGFGMDDADVFFGDTLDHTPTWQGSGDLSALAGSPVRLRVALSDADLYSLRFAE